MYSRIFGVITGRQFRLCLGQVERTSIGLGRSGYQINDKCNEHGYMTRKKEPTPALQLDELRSLHRPGKNHDSKHR